MAPSLTSATQAPGVAACYALAEVCQDGDAEADSGTSTDDEDRVIASRSAPRGRSVWTVYKHAEEDGRGRALSGEGRHGLH